MSTTSLNLELTSSSSVPASPDTNGSSKSGAPSRRHIAGLPAKARGGSADDMSRKVSYDRLGRRWIFCLIWTLGTIGIFQWRLRGFEDPCNSGDVWTGHEDSCAVAMSGGVAAYSLFSMAMFNAVLVPLPKVIWGGGLLAGLLVIPLELTVSHNIPAYREPDIAKEFAFGRCKYLPNNSYAIESASPLVKFCNIGNRFSYVYHDPALNAAPGSSGPVTCTDGKQTPWWRYLNQTSSPLAVSALSGTVDAQLPLLFDIISNNKWTGGEACTTAIHDVVCDTLFPACDSDCVPQRPCQASCTAVQKKCPKVFKLLRSLLPGGTRRTEVEALGVPLSALTGLTAEVQEIVDMVLLGVTAGPCHLEELGTDDTWTCLSPATDISPTEAASDNLTFPSARFSSASACTGRTSALPATGQCSAASLNALQHAQENPPDSSNLNKTRDQWITARTTIFTLLVIVAVMLPAMYCLRYVWTSSLPPHVDSDMVKWVKPTIATWWAWMGWEVPLTSIITLTLFGFCIHVLRLQRGGVIYEVIFAILALACIEVAVRWLCWYPQNLTNAARRKAANVEKRLPTTWWEHIIYRAKSLHNWYKSMFSLEYGRYFLVKQNLMEWLEVAAQLYNVTTLSSSTDSWEVFVLVCALCINMVVSPLLTLSHKNEYRRDLALIFDTILDLFYVFYTFYLRPLSNMNTAYAIAVGYPITMQLVRLRSLSTFAVLNNTGLSKELPKFDEDEDDDDDKEDNGHERLHLFQALDRLPTFKLPDDSDDEGCTVTRVLHIIYVAIVASLAIAFAVSTIARISGQEGRCNEIVGREVWQSSFPKIYFRHGLWEATDCNWEAVLELPLSSRPLTSLSPNVHLYSKLTTLDVSHTLISELPPTLASVTTLRSVNLSHTLVNSIPLNFGLPPTLTDIDLSHSLVSFIHPSWLDTWANSAVNIDGTPFALHVNYSHLNLSSLPAKFEERLQATLQYLDLSYNQFRELPHLHRLGTYNNLRNLSLHHNQVQYLPTLWSLVQLESVDLSHNMLSTILDDINFVLWTRLAHLDLSYNLLTYVTYSLNAVPGSSVHLQGNNVTSLRWEKRPVARLGNWLGQLQDLTSLTCQRCQLTQINPVLLQLPKLKVLDLLSNPLEGSTVDIAVQMPQLEFLALGDSLLQLPTDWSNMTRLRHLEFSNLRNAKVFPSTLLQAPLTYLDMFAHFFTSFPGNAACGGSWGNLEVLLLAESKQVPSLWNGMFPWCISSLKELNLEEQELTSLPPTIGNLTQLTSLNLKKCKLTALPAEMSGLTSLTFLDLTTNDLSGFPAPVLQLPALETLNMEGNTIPTLSGDFTGLSSLTVLDIRKTKMETGMEAVANATSLETLYIHENKYSSLPPSFFSFPKLSKLYMGSTSLSGLPPQVARLTTLRTLYIVDSSLSGVPSQLGQLVNLTRLDLIRCSLPASGLPSELGRLTKLKSLNLGGNGLTFSSLKPEIQALSDVYNVDIRL